MASTSTGFHPQIIVREQGGQRMTWTSGCTLQVQNGAYFRDENITTVTTSGVYGTTVASRGLVYLNPVSSGNITIQFTSPEGIGQSFKVIVANSTKKKARIFSGNTACTIGGTSVQGLIFTTEASIKPFQVGGYARAGVELTAITANRWIITAPWSTLTANIASSSGRTS